MQKKIMILGASILQLPAIEKALAMGLQVVVADMNPAAVGMTVAGVTAEVVSTIDIPAVLAAAKRHGIDGIMTLASDMPMRTVAAVAEELGLVGVSADTAVKATDKAVMRKALQDNGVPIPCFYKVANEEEYLAAIAALHTALVVKPADNSGSRGIYKVTDFTDREKLLEIYAYSKQFSRNGDVVVEEYMQGDEVSVETLTVDGECHVIQITDKITTGAPHFVEIGHTQPTAFSPAMAARIASVAQAANRAVGITAGPSHTEIMVTDEGPKIVEIGARLGGDCITTHLVPLSTGVDMVECCIRIALGEKPDVTPKFAKGSAIRYFPQTAGVVTAIRGLTEAREVAGVQQVTVVHGEGETVTAIDSSTARMGYVIAQGVDAVDAGAVCAAALDKLCVTIE